MKNKIIKLVIFDAYGVVLNGGYPDTCKFLANKFGGNWQDYYEVIYKKWFNQAAERKITQKEAWVKATQELNLKMSWQDLRKKHYSLMSRNEEANKFALSLRGKIKTLLLSKNTRSQFSDIRKKLKYEKNFDCLINTWELGLPKASKKTIEYILNKFKVSPDEVVYLDDQEENLIEAKKMGIKTFYYKDNQQLKIVKKYLELI